jgi:hypothetical protein
LAQRYKKKENHPIYGVKKKIASAEKDNQLFFVSVSADTCGANIKDN